MAFEVKKINPLDLQPRKAIGVNIPFSGTAVFNSTYLSKDSIKANLINFFLTGRGERLYRPTFGSGLRDLLFENIQEDTLATVESYIREGLTIYFPQILVTNLQVEGDPDFNKIDFYMSYAVAQSNIEDELLINFQQ
jgi:phage baseplate assembly protein W